MTAKALWHNLTDSWLEEVLPIAQDPSGLLIKALYSMISQGTEKTIVTSKFTKKLASKMTVPHMKGNLGERFTYGYSMVGEVIEGNVDFLGQKVHLMHPHVDLFYAMSDDVYLVPESMDPQIATFASNMETAVNAIWDSEIEIGDNIQIMGYGVIGSLLASIIHRFPGVDYEIIEKNDKRRKLAKQHGHPVAEGDRSGESFDIIFNTTSEEQMIQKAFQRLVPDGKLIEMSWYGEKSVTLKLGSDFHYGRKRIISSQVSRIPLKKQPSWNFKKRKELVFRLLEEIDLRSHIDAVIPYSTTPQFFQQLRNEDVNNFSTIIKY